MNNRYSGQPCLARVNVSDFQQGFTLLEMVLVLLIMGMVAGLSVAFIDNEDSQLRYEESMQKLTVLRDSVLAERRYQNQIMLSGFAIDNGVLPSDITSLISTKPTGWSDFSPKEPKYKISSSESIYQTLSDAWINKGYRAGSIRSGVDSQNNFKDGWGDEFSLVVASNDLTVQYSGTGKTDSFDTDVNKDVSENDWGIALSEIDSFVLKNETATDIDCSLSCNYVVAISVFKNADTSDPNDRWHTFHVDLTGSTISSGDSEVIPLSWLKDDATSADSERIPAGKHPIFLVDDSVSPQLVKDKAVLKVIPRFTQPTVTLIVE